MSYYDNVKDNVEDKGDSSKPNFDTLRQAAEEHSENEDKQEGDNTEIEVLNETGLKDKSSGRRQQKQQQRQKPQKKQQPQQPSQNRQQVGSQQQTGQEMNTSSKTNVDNSGVEDKLDKIIEQNKKMIDILESFGS